MKLWKRLAAGAAALALCGSIAGTLAVPAHAVDDNNDDWLHAVGSRLYDKDGNEVWLTGANWFGFNCSENCAHGMYAADCDAFLQAVAAHGINIIRFPISTELLCSWMNGEPDPVQSVQASYSPPEDVIGEDGSITPAGTYGNINKDFVLSDGKTLKNSYEIFQVMMQKMKQYGIKALIDVHSPTAHNSGHNYNIWYYDANTEAADTMAVTEDGHEMTYQEWIDSITWLAEQYANDDTIIAYDLKNEPHGKRGYDGTTCPDGIARWDDSDLKNNWAHAATECGNSILSVNPNALILIEGVEQYPKTEKGYTYDTADIWQAPADVSPWYGAWWGGNLRGVRDYPIDFGSDKKNAQIVYSPHDYGPSVYEQTWFNKDFDTDTLLADYWYDTWAYIEQEDIAPLLIGEWGGHMDGGKNQKWMTLLRDYMIEHHINHTFWCLNPNSGDTGGLLGYDFTTWDEDKYGLFEPSLWQTSTTGKYISLDHATPLGGAGSSTGISVTEYYQSYAASEGSNLSAGDKTDPVETETTAPTQDATSVPTEAATKAPTEAPTAQGELTVTRWGDADEDGDTDIIDVITVNKDQLGSATLSAQGFVNADVDRDGIMKFTDAVYIMQSLVDLVTLPIEK
ncbi:MAG: cellulase family glycosylhydrolase [Oscillospiraceae bacterium]|nr:cellulase family glycosylhydrolase [Oscillospiraceae bacterium]